MGQKHGASRPGASGCRYGGHPRRQGRGGGRVARTTVDRRHTPRLYQNVCGRGREAVMLLIIQMIPFS